MPEVTLSEITPELEPAVRALRVAPGQERFVSSVEESLAYAVKEPRANPWIRALLADGTPTGFVMVSWDVVPVAGEIWGPYFLWKLLVDARHQRRGLGRAAVALVADAVAADGATELLTSCVPGPGSPQPFYEGLGFVPTGEVDPDGEVILSLDLTRYGGRR